MIGLISKKIIEDDTEFDDFAFESLNLCDSSDYKLDDLKENSTALKDITLVPNLSNVGSTMVSFGEITNIKTKQNPFLDNYITSGEKLEEELEENLKKPNETLENPPKYINNRKKYIGSPNIALVRANRLIKRMPNKLIENCKV